MLGLKQHKQKRHANQCDERIVHEACANLITEAVDDEMRHGNDKEYRHHGNSDNLKHVPATEIIAEVLEKPYVGKASEMLDNPRLPLCSEIIWQYYPIRGEHSYQ